MKKKTTWVILANLGGPSNTSEIYPFLRNLFSDRDIFSLPFGKLGQDAFSWLIATLRQSKSKKYYEQIGGGSPLSNNTKRLVKAVQNKFTHSDDIKVTFFQRYWHPFANEVAQTIQPKSCQKILLIPLYPHYSTTTSLSVIKEWNRHSHYLPKTVVIDRFYQRDDFTQCCVEVIQKKVSQFSIQPHILFSAHSIPIKRIQQGDPYEHEIRENMQAIMKCMGGTFSYSLCFQSKVGPIPWLKPSVEEEIDRLVALNKKHIAVVPLSFVSENLETLYELDIQKKNYAIKKGIKQFERIETVQSSPQFVNVIHAMISENI